MSRDAEEGVCTGPKTYLARALRVADVDGEVRIEPHDEPMVVVEIRGSADAVRAVCIEREGDALILCGEAHRATSRVVIARGNSTVIMNGGRVVIHRGGGTTVMSAESRSDLRAAILVPRGLPLTLQVAGGAITVGDVRGPIDIMVQGSGTVRAASAEQVHVDVQGSGRVHIASVTRDVHVRIRGSGDVQIDRGTIASLDVAIFGSGDMRFEGAAHRAQLAISGSGDIDVAYVDERPHSTVRGSGSIRVRNW